MSNSRSIHLQLQQMLYYYKYQPVMVEVGVETGAEGARHPTEAEAVRTGVVRVTENVEPGCSAKGAVSISGVVVMTDP